MFVRRKPNKTGTVSVQVISKQSGKYRMMRSFGVGRTNQELVILEEHARQFSSSNKALSVSYLQMKTMFDWKIFFQP